MKESDHILSELRLRDSGDDVCLQLGVFGKRDNFGGQASAIRRLSIYQKFVLPSFTQKGLKNR